MRLRPFGAAGLRVVCKLCKLVAINSQQIWLVKPHGSMENPNPCPGHWARITEPYKAGRPSTSTIDFVRRKSHNPSLS